MGNSGTKNGVVMTKRSFLTAWTKMTVFASQAASGDRRSSGHKTPSMTLDTNGPPYLKFLARPEAATKANDSVAARDQHSAVSF